MPTVTRAQIRRRRLAGVLLGVFSALLWEPALLVTYTLFSGVPKAELWAAGTLVIGLLAALSLLQSGGRSALLDPDTRAALLKRVLLDGGVIVAILAGLTLAGMLPWRARYLRGLVQTDLRPILTLLDAIRGVLFTTAAVWILRPAATGKVPPRVLAVLTLAAAAWMAPSFDADAAWAGILALGATPLALLALTTPRDLRAPISTWLLEERPHQVRLRLSGFTVDRFHHLAGTGIAAGLAMVAAFALLELAPDFLEPRSDDTARRMYQLAATFTGWTGVHIAIRGLMRFVLHRWKHVDLTLTPTSARIGAQRIEARNLQLGVVQDAEGTLLVVGDGVVLSADVDPDQLQEVVRRVRSHVVQDTDADVASARSALGDLTSHQTARPDQIWLEHGRRRTALGQLIPPAVLAIPMGIIYAIDPTPVAAVLLLVPIGFLTFAVARVVRWSRAGTHAPTHSASREAESSADNTLGEATVKDSASAPPRRRPVPQKLT